MSGIDLDIMIKGGKTHTTFRMKWYETITFHNWERDPLTVTIQGGDGEGPVLEEGDTPVDRISEIRGSSKAYKIRASYTGTYFKYTAKIGNDAAAEDPIVIIEK